MKSGWSVWGLVECLSCGYQWTAIVPDKTPLGFIECPECHNHGAKSKTTIDEAIAVCREHVRIGKAMELDNGIPEALEMVLDYTAAEREGRE